MKTRSFKSSALGAVLTALSTACGAATPPLQAPPASPQGHARVKAPHRAKPELVSGDLYVANYASNTVTAYVPGKTTPTQTIAWGISAPVALAFDTTGNLYVANSGNNTVTVYSGSGGSRTWVRTISQNLDVPYAMAFDSVNNDIYVANLYGGGSGCGGSGCGSITVYSTGGTYLATITDGVNQPESLSVDSAGDIYLANFNADSVPVYSPQSNQLILTITKGVKDPSWPDAVAFDGSNNVYVGNSGANTVTVYAHGSGTLSRTVSQGVDQPDGIAIDSSNNLYVADDSSYVSVYAAGSGTEEKKITSGVYAPYALAIGPFNYLFLANGGPSKNGSITWYAPGTGNLQGTITTGISAPIFLAFGP